MTTPPQETTLPDEPGENHDPEPEAEDTEELDPDEPPDVWLDSEDLYDDLTEEEAGEGRHLGEVIDTDDDKDAG